MASQEIERSGQDAFAKSGKKHINMARPEIKNGVDRTPPLNPAKISWPRLSTTREKASNSAKASNCVKA